MTHRITQLRNTNIIIPKKSQTFTVADSFYKKKPKEVLIKSILFLKHLVSGTNTIKGLAVIITLWRALIACGLLSPDNSNIINSLASAGWYSAPTANPEDVSVLVALERFLDWLSSKVKDSSRVLFRGKVYTLCSLFLINWSGPRTSAPASLVMVIAILLKVETCAFGSPITMTFS